MRRELSSLYGLILILAVLTMGNKQDNTITFKTYCNMMTTCHSSFLPSEIFTKQNDETVAVKPIVKKVVKLVSRGIPRESTGEFKTYMSYKAITDRSSEQYKLQLKCKTDENGFRRFGKYYTVAMGTYYSESVGKKFKVTFDTGNEIYVIIGDIKQDRHTNVTNQYVALPNKNIIEFIVNPSRLNNLSRVMGDVSHSEGDILTGGIVKIEEIIE